MLAEAYEQDKQYQNSIVEYQHYQQACDPAELDSIQGRINKLVRKVKGEPEPAEEPAIVPSASKDTSVKAGAPAASDKEKGAPQTKKAVRANKAAPTAKEGPQTPSLTSATAEECFQQAVALYSQGKYNEALPFLKKAVVLDRGYAAGLLLRRSCPIQIGSDRPC